jgi:hypothetical protein
MHDIDRTQKELEMESHEFEHEHGEHEHAEHEQEHGEHEHGELEHEGEAFLGALFGEAEHEHGEHEHGEHEHGEHEHEHAEHELGEHELELELEAESPLNEAQEMELASELLEVSNEAELEYFFGKLARMAARGVKGFVRSSGGRMLGGMLKGLAKKALPIAGAALGTAFGGPLGGKLGGSLGNWASGLFEMELEGLNHEDREFEVARQVVRLGAAAVNRAVRTPRTVNPRVAARRAFTAAARLYAPGLQRRRVGCRTCAARRRADGYYGGRPSGVGPGYRRRPNGAVRLGGRGSVGGFRGAEPTYYGPGYGGSSRGGRWIRRGRNVVLLGL